jgi:hypothetical protein
MKKKCRQVVGKINRRKVKRYALLNSALGSNDINLGICVTYADINHTLILGKSPSRKKARRSLTARISSATCGGPIIPSHLPDRAGCVFNEAFPRSPNCWNRSAELSSCVCRYDPCPRLHTRRLLQIFQNGQEQKGWGSCRCGEYV